MGTRSISGPEPEGPTARGCSGISEKQRVRLRLPWAQPATHGNMSGYILYPRDPQTSAVYLTPKDLSVPLILVRRYPVSQGIHPTELDQKREGDTFDTFPLTTQIKERNANTETPVPGYYGILCGCLGAARQKPARVHVILCPKKKLPSGHAGARTVHGKVRVS